MIDFIYFLIFISPQCISAGEEAVAECQVPHRNEGWSKFYCGYELGSNYTRHGVYSCKGGPPKIVRDCALNPHESDKYTPDKYCRKNDELKGHETHKTRGCQALVFCTPKFNFCGFKNMQEVENEIRATVADKMIANFRIGELKYNAVEETGANKKSG